MTAHPDVETLSTYLDYELSSRERSRVEEHLEVCDDCRQRLSGLEGVVGGLKNLERLAPPAHLGPQLHRLASLEASRPSLFDRLERGVTRVNLQSNLVPIFAIVMALILIIYLLSWGIHRQANGRIPVHLEPPGAQVDAVAAESSRELAGRTFDLIDGVWVERGLVGQTVAEHLSGSSPRVQSWFADHAGLAEIADLGGRVRLAIEETVVEIRFDEP